MSMIDDEDVTLRQLRRRVEALAETLPAEELLTVEEALTDYIVSLGWPYAERVEEIVAALVSEQPQYSFRLLGPEDPAGCPATYFMLWYDRQAAPLHFTMGHVKNWRAVHGDLPERDATDTPPVADAANEELPETMQEPRLRVARSDLAVAREYGHPEPLAAPADPADGEAAEREAELAAEIERLRDAIAALDGETAQRTLPSAQPEQRPGRAPVSEFERKVF